MIKRQSARDNYLPPHTHGHCKCTQPDLNTHTHRHAHIQDDYSPCSTFG